MPLSTTLLAATLSTCPIQTVDLKIDVRPERLSLSVVAEIALDPGRASTEIACLMTPPQRVDSLVDADTGQVVSHAFEPIAEGAPVQWLRARAADGAPLSRLVMRYAYDEATFFGFAPNPATNDRLILGQLTPASVYATHLFYYPTPPGGSSPASLAVTVPSGWSAVSAGTLVGAAVDGERATFRYRAGFSNHLLPFPLALDRYRVTAGRYMDRLPVTIHARDEHAAFAAEKMTALTSEILPFLEGLLGRYPFPDLRIVEVFPIEGNTGVSAAPGVVVLSDKVWFAEAIDGDLTAAPAMVLVDEVAHQWNFHLVQLPNYVAEGLSEYTGLLFREHVRGRDALTSMLRVYREAYLRLAASAGELPISDPAVSPALYFLKGALAMNALRDLIGDAAFKRGMRAAFDPANAGPRTLDDLRAAFEGAAERPLDRFFQRWYHETGLD